MDRSRPQDPGPAAGTIPPSQAGTLDGLFRARVAATPAAPAYRYFDEDQGRWCTLTWAQADAAVQRWRAALAGEGLAPGERVAVMARNGPEWVFFEQAALSLGLVVIPLYLNDRGENLRYILEDAGARLLLIEGLNQWRALNDGGRLPETLRVISLKPLPETEVPHSEAWLAAAGEAPEPRPGTPDALATLVYTSGTTGRPKGVMLSHRNILENAYAALCAVPARQDDLLLSFLPLSHMLERTAGYYLPMMAGACVAFARSILHLAEDLQQVRPTVVILVPRVLERFYARLDDALAKRPAIARALFRLGERAGWAAFLRRQGRGGAPLLAALHPVLDRKVGAMVRERFGGRLRLAVSGGAPLPPAVARRFIALGVNVLQGYGLTEAGPVVSVNREADNRPEGVGPPLPGVEVRLGPENELWVRGPSVMQGYWNNPEASAAAVDEAGWLHTGDQAVLEDGHLRIVGRLKEIIVLSNGEKVSPVDMEMALELDPLIEQAMVVGDDRPFLSAVLVLNEEHWRELAQQLELDPEDRRHLEHPKVQRAVLARVREATRAFPGYARIRGVVLDLEPWTVEAGLLTPTLKLRRRPVLDRYRQALDRLYERL